MREKRPVWFCITVGLLLCSAGYAAYGLHGYDTERFWLSVVLLFVSAVLFLISFFPVFRAEYPLYCHTER